MDDHDTSLAESVLNKKFLVRDIGYVCLQDYIGGDLNIVNGARCSFGCKVKTYSQDVALIRFLCRNMHTSPFEQSSIRFEMRLPLFLSNIFLMVKESKSFFFPLTELFVFVDKNETYDPERCRYSYDLYHELKSSGCSISRCNCVLDNRIYVDISWKIDLHNLFKFVLEIKKSLSNFDLLDEYMKLIMNVAYMVAPICCKAFEDYLLNSTLFPNSKISDKLFELCNNNPDTLKDKAKEIGLSDSEFRDFVLKIKSSR